MLEQAMSHVTDQIQKIKNKQTEEEKSALMSHIFTTSQPHDGVRSLLATPQLVLHPPVEIRHRGLHCRRVRPSRMHGREMNLVVRFRPLLRQYHLRGLFLLDSSHGDVIINN